MIIDKCRGINIPQFAVSNTLRVLLLRGKVSCIEAVELHLWSCVAYLACVKVIMGPKNPNWAHLISH